MISKFQKLLLILQMFHFDDILLFFHGCSSFSYFSGKYTTYFYFFAPAPHASLKVCFFFIVFLYLPLKLVNFLSCLWRSDFWYIFIY